MNELAELTILLVEDEDELRRKTAAFLGLSCKEVLTAANGREALELIAAHRPDLLLSDIRMPVMDGLALATRLRIEAPTLPIVFCTAFTETDYLLKAGLTASFPEVYLDLNYVEVVLKACGTACLLYDYRKYGHLIAGDDLDGDMLEDFEEFWQKNHC